MEKVKIEIEELEDGTNIEKGVLMKLFPAKQIFLRTH